MANELTQQVQLALNRLGDPAYLAVHPLAATVPEAVPGDSAAARLRAWLVDAIERLRPAAGAGADERTHRLFELRYLGGKSVVRVCMDLGISEAEYYRQHRRGLAALAALVAEGMRAPAEAAEAVGVPQPPAESPAAKTNLLDRPTSFVGREAEIAEARRLLGATQLLTVVGAPGIGKTRLALEVGSRALADHADGVWLVELAALTEAALVPQAVAQELGAREAGGQPAEAALAAHLRGKRPLLVLDDCERLVDACAALLEALLRDCPDLRVLATSREPLRIEGEVVYRLAPLGESAAEQLFLARARAADPGFAPPPDEAEALARICRRLDGIPLAIELAAARVGSMPVAEIEARLEDRFRLLTAGRRTALPRQQTLAASIDFSHELLGDPERALLRRLGVFAGSFELDAASALGAGGGVESDDVVDLLAALVEKSLVLFDRPGGRYRLLETIRAYARARLDEAGETAQVFARQTERLLAFAAEAEPRLRAGGEARATWIERLRRELDDIRAALRWGLEHDAELALRLALGLWRFWWEAQFNSESLRWLSEALARAPADSPSRGRALMAAGFIARPLGEFARARELTEAALPLLDAAGDHEGAALAEHNLGMIDLDRGRVGAAQAHLERSLALSRRAGDRATAARTLRDLAFVAWDRAEADAARALFEESLAEARAIGDMADAALTLPNLAELSGAQGEPARAEALFREGLCASREGGSAWAEAYNLLLLGRFRRVSGDLAGAREPLEQALGVFRRMDTGRWVAWTLREVGNLGRAERDFDAARSHYEESLAVAREVGAVQEVPPALAAAAELARRAGRLQDALGLAREALLSLRDSPQEGNCGRCYETVASVMLAAGRTCDGVRFAGAAAAHPLIDSWSAPDERRAYAEALAAARRVLGEDAFATAWEQGRTMSLEDALRLGSAVTA